MSEQTTRRLASSPPPLPARDYHNRKQNRQNSDAGVNLSASASASAISGRVEYKQSCSVESTRSGGFENELHEYPDRADGKNDRRSGSRGDPTVSSPILSISAVNSNEPGAKASDIQSLGAQLKMNTQNTAMITLACQRSPTTSKYCINAPDGHANGRDETREASVSAASNVHNSDPHESVSGNLPNESGSKALQRYAKKKDKPDALTPPPLAVPVAPKRPQVAPLALSAAQSTPGGSRSGTPARTPPSVPPKPNPTATPTPTQAQFAPLVIDTDPNIVTNEQMHNYLYAENDSPVEDDDFTRSLSARLAQRPAAPSPRPSHPTLMHVSTSPSIVQQQYTTSVSAMGGQIRPMLVAAPNGTISLVTTQLRTVASSPGGHAPTATAYFFGMPPTQTHIPGPATAPANHSRFPYPADPQQAELLAQKQRYALLRRQLDLEVNALSALRREIGDLEARHDADLRSDRTRPTLEDLRAVRKENHELAIDTQFIAFDLDTIVMAGIADLGDESSDEESRPTSSQTRWRSTPSLADWQLAPAAPQTQSQISWQPGVQYAPECAQFVPQAVQLVQPTTGPPGRPPAPSANRLNVNNCNFNASAQPVQMRLQNNRPQYRISDLMDDESRKWSCKACTFLNHPALFTCEICGESR